MSDAANTVCPRCRSALPAEALVCPACGALAHGPTLDRLAAEAQRLEQDDPQRAIPVWEECLKRLPADSRQYAMVKERIDRIRAWAQNPQALEYGRASAGPKPDPLGVAIVKTGLSMVVSIFVYQFVFGLVGAVGFVLLILVHEMGHVFANLYYGLPASPPIFIPFLGAIINLRRSPPNAKVEAVIGIAGPVLGTVGTLAVFAWYLARGGELPLLLSWFGFTINLFNLLPVPPLDGGRVAAAISPWVWVLGLGGLGAMLIADFSSGRQPWLLVILLVYAMPRIVQTLKPGGRSGPYYAIGKIAPVVIGVSYLVLLGTLLVLRWYTEKHLVRQGII